MDVVEPTVIVLRKILKQKGLKVSGNKAELLERLKQAEKEKSSVKQEMKQRAKKADKNPRDYSDDPNDYFHLTLYNEDPISNKHFIILRDIRKDLSKNTVNTLRWIAKNLTIKYYYKMKKDELIKQIQLKLKTTKHKIN